jgi:hypothetical protein
MTPDDERSDDILTVVANLLANDPLDKSAAKSRIRADLSAFRSGNTSLRAIFADRELFVRTGRIFAGGNSVVIECWAKKSQMPEVHCALKVPRPS